VLNSKPFPFPGATLLKKPRTLNRDARS
jgi:hypothetical protein